MSVNVSIKRSSQGDMIPHWIHRLATEFFVKAEWQGNAMLRLKDVVVPPTSNQPEVRVLRCEDRSVHFEMQIGRAESGRACFVEMENPEKARDWFSRFRTAQEKCYPRDGNRYVEAPDENLEKKEKTDESAHGNESTEQVSMRTPRGTSLSLKLRDAILSSEMLPRFKSAVSNRLSDGRVSRVAIGEVVLSLLSTQFSEIDDGSMTRLVGYLVDRQVLEAIMKDGGNRPIAYRLSQGSTQASGSSPQASSAGKATSSAASTDRIGIVRDLYEKADKYAAAKKVLDTVAPELEAIERQIAELTQKRDELMTSRKASEQIVADPAYRDALPQWQQIQEYVTQLAAKKE